MARQPSPLPLAFLLLLSTLASPSLSSVVTSDWQVKDTFLIGQPLTIQEFRTTFSATPHLIETVACPRMECPYEIEPPGCDYTKCSNISPDLCDDYEVACDDGLTWTTLKAGVPFHVTLDDHPANSYKQFRFFFNSSLPSLPAAPSCSAVHVTASPFDGDPDLYVSLVSPYATAEQYDYHEGNHYGDSLTLCPTDMTSLRTSTLYISTFSYGSPASYNITVTVVPLPPYEPPEYCSDFNDTECLPDGLPQSAPSNTQFVYFPQIGGKSRSSGECPIAYFEVYAKDAVSSLQITAYKVVCDDVDCYNRTYGVYDLLAMFGPDSISISLCTTSPDVPDVNIFLLEGFVDKDVEFTVLATVWNIVTLKPVTSYYPFDAMMRMSPALENDLESDISLHCDGDTRLYWMSPTPNAFQPFFVPLAFALNMSSVFPSNNPTYEKNKPPVPVQDTLYLFVLLSDSHFDATPLKCKVIFRPYIVDFRGVMIEPNRIFYSPRSVTCNHTAFDLAARQTRWVMDFITNLTAKPYESSFAALLTLDVIRYDDSWSACERQVDQYLDFGFDVAKISIPTDTYCAGLGDGWIHDDCCNGTLCCPIVNVEATVPVYTNFTPKVNETCVNASCTELFLVDFALSRNTIYRMECAADALIVPESVLSTGSQFYLECQSFFYNAPGKRGRSCASDQDCLIKCNTNTSQCQYSNTACHTDQDCYVGQCDYFEGLCIADRSRWEQLFMECFAATMPPDVLNIVCVYNNLNPADRLNNFSYFVNALLQDYSDPDCVSLSGVGMDALEYRSHSTIQSVVYEGSDSTNCRCTQSIGVKQPCLDAYCQGYDECNYGVYDDPYDSACSPLIGPVPSSEDNCNALSACNANAYASDRESCEGFPSFCGLCEPTSLTCHVIQSVSSPEQCNATNVCVLPNGSYLQSDTPLDCSTLGTCSALCPNTDPSEVQCLSTSPGLRSACFDHSNEEDCEGSNLLGVWLDTGNDTTSLCVYPEINNAVECDRYGKVFASCGGDLSIEECSQCNTLAIESESQCPYPYDVLTLYGFLSCLPLPSHYCTQEECVTPIGDCGDDVFWNQRGYVGGSCLLPFERSDSFSSSRWFCPETTVFAKIGCVDYNVSDALSCQKENSNARWVTPAVTKEECLNYPSGCQSPDSYLTGILANTSRELCEIDCHSKYVTNFQWTPAHWIPARSAVPTWNIAKFESAATYTTTLNFPELAGIVAGTYEASNLLNLREQAICTTSSTLVESLDVMSCSCAPMTFEGDWTNVTMGGNWAGIGMSPPQIDCSEGNPYGVTYSLYHLCQGRRSNIFNSYFSAVCSIDACVSGPYCMQMYTNSTSADLVAQYRSATVSLSFVKIEEDTNRYAVVENDKGVIVGQLIGDATYFNVSTLTQTDGSDNSTVDLTNVCFTVRYDIFIDHDETYSVYDLGVTIGSRIIPMNLSNVELRNPGISEQLCLTHFVVNATVLVVYPIVRIPDYEYLTSDRFNQAELGIIYTTCALYIIAIVTAVFLFSQPVTIQGGFIVNFAVFVQTLALYVIRCVYFFLLGYSIIPTAYSENLPDYILIELPTFFYIGAFSLIALSFLFLYLRAKKGMELSQLNFWAAFFFWDLLIWILFAVVVSLIATLSANPDPVKSCDGRISSTPEQNNTARTIRIAYKSVIALIALFVVSVTFMIGRALSDGPSAGTIFQTQMITCGLFLNCVAFAIYYGVNQPTPYFAIVLWFTEILPTLLLLMMLSPRRMVAAISREREMEKGKGRGSSSSSWN